MPESDTGAALAYLYGALTDAEQAEEIAPDGSRVESVAENTRRWAEQSIEIAEKEVDNDDEE